MCDSVSMSTLLRRRVRTPGMFKFSPGHAPLIPDGAHYTDDANDKVSCVCLPDDISFCWMLVWISNSSVLPLIFVNGCRLSQMLYFFLSDHM